MNEDRLKKVLEWHARLDTLRASANKQVAQCVELYITPSRLEYGGVGFHDYGPNIKRRQEFYEYMRRWTALDEFIVNLIKVQKRTDSLNDEIECLKFFSTHMADVISEVVKQAVLNYKPFNQ